MIWLCEWCGTPLRDIVGQLRDAADIAAGDGAEVVGRCTKCCDRRWGRRADGITPDAGNVSHEKAGPTAATVDPAKDE